MSRRILLIVLLIFFALNVAAAPPATLSYQSRLATAGGLPVSGSLNITFRLYDVASGGAALWTEVQTGVDVDGGNLAVELGSVTPLPSQIWGRQLYLGVQIANDSEMLPRPPLTAAPYALRAAATMQRTIVVSAVGTPAENGAALLAAVGQITDATAESPVAVEIDAGTFDLGTSDLRPPEYTSLIGRGQSATLITSSSIENTGNLVLASTIFLASNSSVRDLTAHHTGVPTGESGSAVGIAAFDLNSFSVPLNNIRLERVTGISSAAAASNGQRAGISVCAANSRLLDVIGVGEGGMFANGLRANCNTSGFLIDGADAYAALASDGLRGAQLTGGSNVEWRRMRIFVDQVPTAFSVYGIRFFGLGSFPSEPQGTLRDSEITIRGSSLATPTNTGRLEGVALENGTQIGSLERVRIQMTNVHARSINGVRLSDPVANFPNIARLTDLSISIDGLQDAALGFGEVVGVQVQGVPPDMQRANIKVNCLAGGFSNCVGVQQTNLHAGTLKFNAGSISVGHVDPADGSASSKAMEIVGPLLVENSSLRVTQSPDAEFSLVLSLTAVSADVRISHSSLRFVDASDTNSGCVITGPTGARGELFANHLQGARCDGGQLNLVCAGNTSRGSGFLAMGCP